MSYYLDVRGCCSSGYETLNLFLRNSGTGDACGYGDKRNVEDVEKRGDAFREFGVKKI